MCSENSYINFIKTMNDFDGDGDDNVGMGLIEIRCKNPITGESESHSEINMFTTGRIED
jgi:hypothetical protein